ncbi:MAG: MBL fold metallo-hydrolase [Candidatus Margulisbacteria bacterium]|nr:MBL fold metallo-hydrolase [Candidatus Margulisiibacteriota bacterium]
MQIKTIKVGELQTNCFIVIDESTKDAVVIDPGDEAGKILAELKGLKVKKLIITHGHYDHVGAVKELKKRLRADVLMHPDDAWLFQPDVFVNDGDEINFGNLALKAIHTPGHTPGGICLYLDGHLFSGDTLFAGTYGRTDLPGGSEGLMAQSLKKLAKLPPSTKVYPGHGGQTTIGDA